MTHIKKTKLFVLDTNVLMHDPSSIFRFQEHDIYLPMVVLEELDAAKKGMSEVSRNVRQFSRFLDEILNKCDPEQIEKGLKIPTARLEQNNNGTTITGRLFFQTKTYPAQLPESLPGNKPDNHILSTTIALNKEFPDHIIRLVSKDINLRIKASVLGIHAEDYISDRALDDLSLLYSGTLKISADFWESHKEELKTWQENNKTLYRFKGPQIKQWYPNQCIFFDQNQPFEAIVKSIKNDCATIEQTTNYHQHHHDAWGIHARNREQNYALNLLMNKDIDFVSLLGMAGTGKTLLTLAAGMVQTLEKNIYSEIIMTRVTVPVGEDIGFLPGTEEEKMTPWMGALMDNLEVLTKIDVGGDWGKAATQELLKSRIKVRSLNFMRGRTFLNKFIILDEAQNLTPKQMKTLVTRAGPGTKIVCIGNIVQIDTPYLTETTSGLTYVIDRFKEWAHSGHVTLIRGERSRLTDYAAEVL